MKNTMHYRGYIGSVEYSEADSLLFGKVQGIRALISYEGKTATELTSDFHEAVDSYLALCEEKGIAPGTAYKGSFSVRVSAALHQKYAEYAINHNLSLNRVVEEAMESYIP